MRQNIIVLVEDSPADARVVTRAIDKLGDPSLIVMHFDTAEAAIEYCEKDAKWTSNQRQIVLMDLNLPGADGLTCLRHFKSSPRLRHIPVIVWTTSDQPRDIQRSYERGANSFVTKPMGLKAVSEMVRDLCHYWFERTTLA
ncbi:MAG: response regulator [Rhodospirillales bacterium]|nr:response regulator [Rhodospirillales bacterium]MBO6786878.1 response regulator [Rhodospirillales bacterium]